MNITPGEMLFYGGLAGIGLVALFSIIAIVVLAVSWKRMHQKQIERYGKISND